MQKVKDFLSFELYKEVTVSTFLLIVISCIIAFYALKLVRRLVTAKLSEDDKNKFISIFKVTNYIIYILIIITILHASGVNLTLILTASAALFVGLGFALQHLFQDVISGILIILDKSLQVGDIIELENKVGKVFDIRLRTTRALTRDDKVIVIPNHKFLTDTIYNYTQNHKMTRESVKVGVAYESDTAKVEELLLQCMNQQNGILKKPKPFVLFEDFGDSALLFSLHFYVSDSYIDPKIKSDIRFRIDTIFRQHNIKIPFPQRDVHIISQNKIAQ